MSWTDHFKEDRTVFPSNVTEEDMQRVREMQRQMRLRILNAQIGRTR